MLSLKEINRLKELPIQSFEEEGREFLLSLAKERKGITKEEVLVLIQWFAMSLARLKKTINQDSYYESFEINPHTETT